jgi:hypothetical protein
MIRADEHEEGTVIRVRPGHPYDTRWRIVGRVDLDDQGRPALFGGVAPDGSRTFDEPAGWVVATDEPRPSAEQSRLLDPEPSNDDIDPEAEADRYERGLEARMARRGWA